jgi:hypothetical protein
MKILSSKILLPILLIIHFLFVFSFSGAVIMSQYIASLLGSLIMIFILFFIFYSFIKKKDIYYSLNLAIIIYWALSLFPKMLFV